MKKILLLFIVIASLNLTIAQNLVTENFDVFPATWTALNTSVPAGANNWGQATAAQTPYFGGGTGAYNGDATSYAFANFNSTTGSNTISNWLITTPIMLMNGDIISFYSSKGLSGGTTVYPDNLQLRISTNGAASANPVGPTGVGDYTTLAIDINPTLTTTGYPNAWTLYTYTVTGTPNPTSCRIAFRYFVTNGGPTGANSDQVGIDAFSVDRPLSTEDFFTSNFSIYPNPATEVLYVNSKNGTTINSLQVLDIKGRVVNQVTVSTQNTQLNVSDLNSGIYFVKVQTETGIGTSKFIKN